MSDEKSELVPAEGEARFVQTAEPGVVKVVEALPEPTVGQMITMCIDKGMDPSTMGDMFALYERMNAFDAKRKFNEALAEFQRQCPVMKKNREVDFGRTKSGAQGAKYNYTTYDYLMLQLKPVLQRTGFSVVQDQSFDGNVVTIHTTKKHIKGHEETTSLSGPIDANLAGSNSTQKMGSAISYLKRYGVLNAFNIATTNEDDDGYSAGTQLIDENQLANIEALMDEVGFDKEPLRGRFLTYLNVKELADLPQRSYVKAVKTLEKKRGGGHA